MENMDMTPESSQFIHGGGNTESTPKVSDAVARFPRASIFEHESEWHFYCNGDEWVQDAIDSINLKRLPRSRPVVDWDNQWFQAHPDRRTLLRLPAEEEIEKLEMELFKYEAVLATAVRSDNLQRGPLLVWAPRTLLNKHEDIDLGEEIAAQLFEVELKRVRKTEFEIKLAEYRRRKPDWDFFALPAVRELSKHVADWIDAGMLPEDALVRLVNEQPVHCSPAYVQGLFRYHVPGVARQR